LGSGPIEKKLLSCIPAWCRASKWLKTELSTADIRIRGVFGLSIHASAAMKGGRSMHTLHLADTLRLKSLRGRPVEDVVYQAVTLGAILLVLGTLWAF
jgi:hypothetical protein